MPGLDSAMIVQWGKETFGFEGTPAAATERCLVESFDITPVDEIARPRLHRGGLIRAQGDEFASKRGVEFAFAGPLLFEQIHTWLSLMLRGNVTPSGTGDNRTWAFARTGTTALQPNACTFERRLSDAAGNTEDIEFPYGFLSSLEIVKPGDGPVTLSGTGFGQRIDDSSTLTTLSGLDAQPGVEYPVAPRVALYIDDNNSFGTTQVSSKVLEATLKLGGGWLPMWTADNRTDLDWTLRVLDPEQVTCELEVTCLVDPAGSGNGEYVTERTKAEAASMRFVRLFMEGRDIGTGTNTSVAFDMTMKHTPGTYATIGQQDGQDIVTFTLQEATNYTDNYLEATVVNARSAICDGALAV